jgi:ubiquinone/menaquinone biosynthesis C-methylase UbiE
MNGRFYDFMVGATERRVFAPLRAELLASLAGRVVVLGAGTGADFPYFGPRAMVVALEPDPSMAMQAKRRIRESAALIELKIGDDSYLDSMDIESVDAVVCSLVLCTIPDPERALGRIRRVLKPDGTLVVIEHVRAPGRAGRVQDVFAPLWKVVGDGCHLNRDTEEVIAAAGFSTRSLRTRRIPLSPIQTVVYGALPVG